MYLGMPSPETLDRRGEGYEVVFGLESEAIKTLQEKLLTWSMAVMWVGWTSGPGRGMTI